MKRFESADTIAHMSILKAKNGITLIALIITIIVLLILAGVSIALVFGENGIVFKAQLAKDNTSVAQEKEYLSLAYSGASADKGGVYVTEEDFQSELDSLAGNGNTRVTTNPDGSFNVLYVNSGNQYTVRNGKIRNTVSSNIADAWVVNYGPYHNTNFITVLYQNRRLVRKDYGTPSHHSYLQYDSEGETLIAENVIDYKDLSGRTSDGYYITTDYTLYLYTDGESIQMGTNVDRVFEVINNSSFYFLTKDNRLCIYDKNDTENPTRELAQNVIDFGICKNNSYYYIDTNNDLYLANGSKIATNVRQIVSFKRYWSDNYYYAYYLTENNEIYEIPYYSNTNQLKATNAKSMIEWFYLDQDDNLRFYGGSNNDVIMENVKFFESYRVSSQECCILTNDNKLYFYNGSSNQLVGEDVTQVYTSKLMYLKSNGDLYCFNSFSDTEGAMPYLKKSNVNYIYEDGSYSTNDNRVFVEAKGYSGVDEYEVPDFIDYNPDRKMVMTKNGTFFVDTAYGLCEETLNCGNRWYEDIDGNLQFYLEGSADISW